ncbi:hypothetical protein ABIB66_008247 [Bradyrhizobium sp. F1.13.3]
MLAVKGLCSTPVRTETIDDELAAFHSASKITTVSDDTRNTISLATEAIRNGVISDPVDFKPRAVVISASLSTQRPEYL